MLGAGLPATEMMLAAPFPSWLLAAKLGPSGKEERIKQDGENEGSVNVQRGLDRVKQTTTDWYEAWKT